MTMRSVPVLSAVALAASTIAGVAAPCSSQIARLQARIDARLEAAAAAGPTAKESTAATMHRQPTPGSIAAAESRLGDIPNGTMKAVESAMARAREADRRGEKAACERAIARAQRALMR